MLNENHPSAKEPGSIALLPGEVQAVRRGTAPRLPTHPGLPGNHHWQRPPEVDYNYNHNKNHRQHPR